MAAAQCAAPTMRRKRTWTGTPEVYFAKAIDNSRLVKVENPQRSREMKQALRLEEASLRDPERIDTLARKLGLQSPQAGQVLRMNTASPDAATPVLASVTPVTMDSAR